MKKLITFALALVLFSCAKEEKPEYTIISGKLTGTEDGKFTLSGNSFEKEITLNSDGTFTDTLNLEYNGAYEIYRQPLYLQKGKNLRLEANIENLSEIKYTGDLAAENNYLTEKSKLRKEILGNGFQELYSLEEEEFLNKNKEFDTKIKEILGTSIFTVEEFKEKESKNLDYLKNVTLSRYESYHAHFTQKSDFKISENFPKADETNDLDNADEFNFSGKNGAYGILVSENFDKTIREEYNKQVGENEPYNPEVSNQIALNTFKAIKSQNIKNALANDVSYGINPSNEKSEELYNEIIANVTDENFKTKLTEKYNKIKALTKGKSSPKFNYENHKGGTTSLDDLKGKFVYIDVWATWCGPCIREIPFMKIVEEKYHGKNIEFVSISIDDKKDYEKWKAFVSEREMGGIQLFADNAWQSQFVQDYVIDGIPRFILLDSEGKIVSADAPRPSDEKLIELFSELGL